MYIRLFVLILLLNSCTDTVSFDKGNSFFIRYHTQDSMLQNDLVLASRNKVTYFDTSANLFRVIPINYKTNDFEDMHYFFTEDQSEVKPENGMILYDIELKDSARYDSTSFSIKKMIYLDTTWKPKYDMGWINVYFPEYSRAIEESKRKKLADYIIQSIAKDSYTL